VVKALPADVTHTDAVMKAAFRLSGMRSAHLHAGRAVQREAVQREMDDSVRRRAAYQQRVEAKKTAAAAAAAAAGPADSGREAAERVLGTDPVAVEGASALPADI
jgi:hypothetical protein